MAAFVSDRRSGWVRFLVVLLCVLFVFATLGAPAARADALTVGLFTAAAVLSAVTAALGFKLSNSAEGQATLAKMVQDFKVSATAVGLVLVGSKINGLIDGVDYIKMQVKAGKTYLDERVVAWVQQWLGVNRVYNDNVNYPTYITGDSISIVPRLSYSQVLSFFPLKYRTNFDRIVSHYNLDLDNAVFSLNMFSYDRNGGQAFYICIYDNFDINTATILSQSQTKHQYVVLRTNKQYEFRPPSSYTKPNYLEPRFYLQYSSYPNSYGDNIQFSNLSGAVISNGTGLSGTDTIGKDVVDKSLDEVLAGLKEWAPDWWDAGADSSTNGAAVGTKDLPLNMGSDVKTVTGNPALEVDQPLIYTPWFDQTLDNLRNGETAGTLTNTATSAAETADKAEAAQGTVEDAQGVVQSIISWGLDYISPDKGLFSRFPLCIPYDAYLLVTAALGVDAQDLGDIVGQSPGELSAQVGDGVAVQSDFIPVISVKHDWTQDGVTTPVEVTIDLRPYDGVIKMIRTLVSVYVIAELIASEYKRIRGS